MVVVVGSRQRGGSGKVGGLSGNVNEKPGSKPIKRS